MLYQPSSFHLFAVAAATILSQISAIPLENRATVTHWGTGCPQSATDFWVKVDANKVTTHFPAFDVTKGGNVPQSSSEEFCGVGIEFGCPEGRQFAVVSSSYRDSVDVPAGTTASHLMRYGFQGETNTANTRRNVDGPARGTYDATDVVNREERLWSECGSTSYLMITNHGVVTGTGGGASKHSYFNQGDVTTNIEWRSC
ncbi:uncharacterized protein RAG0_14897 [Rhynchosporium agropyri]|uniref:Secreted protein n=1 Tax=Rhynchosporium agropyri TaxID=914238 RepID=A0A1E1LIU9_9HELO|nr:uncharacterized protein RAG0_14897 [Rhynchosporium agropyri]